jgi:hypothetical protein
MTSTENESTSERSSLPDGCYSLAMRRSAAVLVLAALAVAACSGSDDAATTNLTATSAPATTVAEPTTTPDTVTTTVVETTSAPPTTVDDEARLRAAEQAYIAAWEAYHAAILDPSDRDLRAEVERTNTGPNLEATIKTLDGLGLSDKRWFWFGSLFVVWILWPQKRRPSKVMAKALSAGFQRFIHRSWPVPFGSSDLTTR